MNSPPDIAMIDAALHPRGNCPAFAAGVQTVWLGVVPLPDLLLVILGHVAAAIRHHYRLRDGLLTRMRPYWRRHR